mgnify:CR=1 FL=1
MKGIMTWAEIEAEGFEYISASGDEVVFRRGLLTAHWDKYTWEVQIIEEKKSRFLGDIEEIFAGDEE